MKSIFMKTLGIVLLLQFGLISPLFAITASNTINNQSPYVITVVASSQQGTQVSCGNSRNYFSITPKNNCTVQYTSSDNTISGVLKFWMGYSSPCQISYVYQSGGLVFSNNSCATTNAFICVDSHNNLNVCVLNSNFYPCNCSQ